MKVSISLTDREFSALCSAQALYEAQYEDEDDPPPEFAGNVKAFSRVHAKWWAAQDAQSKRRVVKDEKAHQGPGL